MFHPKFHTHSNTGHCFSAPTRKYCQAWVYKAVSWLCFPNSSWQSSQLTPYSFFPFLSHSLFLPNHSACGISVSRPGIEPRPRQWKPGMVTSRPPGNSLSACFLSDALLLPARWAQPSSAVGSAFLRSSSSEQSRPPLSAEPGQSLCQRTVRISERSDTIHFPNWPSTNTTQRRGGGRSLSPIMKCNCLEKKKKTPDGEIEIHF